MSNVKSDFSQLVGNTPLLRLKKYIEINQLNTEILAKLECFNPAGSAKDRIAKKMLLEALQDGKINKDTLIIEPTSGNTGIGLAAICASLGMRIILTMPDTMSVERRELLKIYGAQLVLTDGKDGMQGAVDMAKELKRKNKNSFIPGQFDNHDNVLAHYETTGPEIWRDTDGRVDIFVTGVGTGGTISGVGRYLKEKNENIKIVAVEPDTSPLLSKGFTGDHKLQGIGANFVPPILDREVIDEIVCVSAQQAFEAGRDMVKNEGILVGITSGAALSAAKILSQRLENHGKTIVVFMPDTGYRYLSTEMFL
ncbi:MAG: cysteine synthase A [bacterium]|nr:cysteine synthase A [bacterium]